jgi:hypothetical protein
MPARKPFGLNKMHHTAEEKAARISAESMMTPKRDLPSTPPVQLRGHQVAGAIWRRVIRVYNGLEERIVTYLDLGILVDLCTCEEQLQEMDLMRSSAWTIWESHNEQFSKLWKEKAEFEQIFRVAEQINSAYDDLMKLDARVDAKRKLLHLLRQSLYLTPRARSGINPSKKEKESPVDPFEQMLDDRI